jgi:hypothetical protein
MNKSVHKIVGAEPYADFNAMLNAEIRQGWTKSEPTLFAGDSFCANLTAEVDEILLPISTQAETLKRTDEVYSERFGQLCNRFQTRESDMLVALASGALCVGLTTSELGRFEYRGNVYDLAMSQPDLSSPRTRVEQSGGLK